MCVAFLGCLEFFSFVSPFLYVSFVPRLVRMVAIFQHHAIDHVAISLDDGTERCAAQSVTVPEHQGVLSHHGRCTK